MVGPSTTERAWVSIGLGVRRLLGVSDVLGRTNRLRIAGYTDGTADVGLCDIRVGDARSAVRVRQGLSIGSGAGNGTPPAGVAALRYKSPVYRPGEAHGGGVDSGGIGDGSSRATPGGRMASFGYGMYVGAGAGSRSAPTCGAITMVPTAKPAAIVPRILLFTGLPICYAACDLGPTCCGV